MKLNLSERLRVMAEFAKADDVVADIGTDHGYLPIWLLQNKRCKSVILTDINKGPLEKAYFNIKKYLGKAEADLRQGNGLSVLNKGEVDTVIIAGMGGMLIKKILKADADIISDLKRIILQPHRDVKILREYLINSGNFIIIDERVVKEREKYSEIIVAVPVGCECEIDEKFLLYKEKTLKLANKSNLPKNFFMEFPELYLCGDKECKALLKYRLRGSMLIRDSIINKAGTEEAALRLSYIENRIKNIKEFIKIQEMYSDNLIDS